MLFNVYSKFATFRDGARDNRGGTRGRMAGAGEEVPFTASGLRWEKSGIRPCRPLSPTKEFREPLKNDKLVEALREKQEFTVDEWVGFGIRDLRNDDYVEVGNDYFVPAPTPQWLTDYAAEVEKDVWAKMDADAREKLLETTGESAFYPMHVHWLA